MKPTAWQFIPLQQSAHWTCLSTQTLKVSSVVTAVDTHHYCLRWLGPDHADDLRSHYPWSTIRSLQLYLQRKLSRSGCWDQRYQRSPLPFAARVFDTGNGVFAERRKRHSVFSVCFFGVSWKHGDKLHLQRLAGEAGLTLNPVLIPMTANRLRLYHPPPLIQYLAVSWGILAPAFKRRDPVAGLTDFLKVKGHTEMGSVLDALLLLQALAWSADWSCFPICSVIEWWDTLTKMAICQWKSMWDPHVCGWTWINFQRRFSLINKCYFFLQSGILVFTVLQY